MNFTAHRMNTGLSGIFNEISVGKLMKNDSFPQTTNLARINAGIAEMLFGRVNTPKGIETPTGNWSGSDKSVWKSKHPKGDWNVCCLYFVIIPHMFGRVKTPKGIETLQFPVFLSTVWFGRVNTPKGIETPAFPSSVSLADVWKDRNPKGDLT